MDGATLPENDGGIAVSGFSPMGAFSHRNHQLMVWTAAACADFAGSGTPYDLNAGRLQRIMEDIHQPCVIPAALRSPNEACARIALAMRGKPKSCDTLAPGSKSAVDALLWGHCLRVSL